LVSPTPGDRGRRDRTWWAESAADRDPSSHADSVAFGIDLDKVRPLFAEYVARSLHDN
jgi:hypothetical protein